MLVLRSRGELAHLPHLRLCGRTQQTVPRPPKSILKNVFGRWSNCLDCGFSFRHSMFYSLRLDDRRALCTFFMRLIKILLTVVLVCTATCAVVYSLVINGILTFGGEGESVTPPPTAHVPEISCRPLDLKAVRARSRVDQKYLSRTEESALAVYDTINPADSAWYTGGRMAIELYICQTVGDDFYGEGLLQNADAYARAAYSKGCRDPMILAICDIYTFQRNISLKLAGANEQFENCQRLLGTDYPIICALDAATIGLKNTITFSDEDFRSDWRDDMTPALSNAGPYFDMVFDSLGKLIRDGAPNQVVSTAVDRLLSAVNMSPGPMEEISKRLNATLDSADAPENLQALCMGNFFTDWAWTARGTGWAKSVTPQGWSLMKERLASAQKVLEKAQENFPDDPSLPTELLTVELGQGIGKYRMQRLFDQAVARDPGN